MKHQDKLNLSDKEKEIIEDLKKRVKPLFDALGKEIVKDIKIDEVFGKENKSPFHSEPQLQMLPIPHNEGGPIPKELPNSMKGKDWDELRNEMCDKLDQELVKDIVKQSEMKPLINKAKTPVKWRAASLITELIITAKSKTELQKFYGRIIAVDKESASDKEGVHAVIYCSTPHGTLVRVGIAHVTILTEKEDFNKLEEYETIAKDDNEWYANNGDIAKLTD